MPQIVIEGSLARPQDTPTARSGRWMSALVRSSVLRAPCDRWERFGDPLVFQAPFRQPMTHVDDPGPTMRAILTVTAKLSLRPMARWGSRGLIFVIDARDRALDRARA